MKPLAVSMGDPAGIGLEIAARVWADRPAATPPFFLVGDADAFLRASARLQAKPPRVHIAQSLDALAAAPAGAMAILETPLAMDETPGAPDPVNARAILASIEGAVGAVRAGAASAVVTLPIAKAVLQRTGFAFPGHTEFIASLTEDLPWSWERGPVMLLAGASLKVALATIHVPLRQASALITHERIVRVGTILGEALKRDFGVEAPRMALCGLNPHAGEDGHIGREEIEAINPAAAQLREAGWNIGDAQPPDSLFHAEARAKYDAVIALYHDQGLIPLKTLHFWDAVNITLGLPIVRTSPDHGTGFDIAGKGIARPDSFLAALHLAWDMAQRRSQA